jgi:hypothetical protein
MEGLPSQKQVFFIYQFATIFGQTGHHQVVLEEIQKR